MYIFILNCHLCFCYKDNLDHQAHEKHCLLCRAIHGCSLLKILKSSFKRNNKKSVKIFYERCLSYFSLKTVGLYLANVNVYHCRHSS